MPYVSYFLHVKVLNSNIIDYIARALAMGLSKDVCVWNNYYINNFNFHKHRYGKDKSTTNYGVCIGSVDRI